MASAAGPRPVTSADLTALTWLWSLQPALPAASEALALSRALIRMSFRRQELLANAVSAARVGVQRALRARGIASPLPAAVGQAAAAGMIHPSWVGRLAVLDWPGSRGPAGAEQWSYPWALPLIARAHELVAALSAETSG